MKEGTAIEIIERKMCEMGQKNYLIRYRHFQVHPGETLIVQATNQFFALIAPSTPIKVESKAGIYDLEDAGINEMQYLHRGKITIENTSQKQIAHIKFIQAIPTHKTKHHE